MVLFIVSLSYLIRIYSYLILIYILIGYFPEARNSKVYQVLNNLCEPLLNLFRFAVISGISFAPILAIFFLELIYYTLRVLFL